MGLTRGTYFPMLVKLDMKKAAQSPRAAISRLLIQIADETRETTVNVGCFPWHFE
jgi:hypothetical protein